MKQFLLPFLASALLTTACNNNKNASTTSNTTDQSASNASGANNSMNNISQDGEAIATIETETYIATIHKAFPFMVGDDKPNDGYRPKIENQFIALDMSVRSKSATPIDMGAIISGSKITDEKGTQYGNFVKSLGAYYFTQPDPKLQEEYSALVSAEFGPKESHRAIALTFEAPKDVNTFVINMPVKPNANEKKQATFSLK